MVRCIVLKKQIWVYTFHVGIAILERSGLRPVEIDGKWYIHCEILGTGQDGGVLVKLPNGEEVEVEKRNVRPPRRAA